MWPWRPDTTGARSLPQPHCTWRPDLPNFFIQHIPWPSDERDRRMRSELVSQPIETVVDGFAELPVRPGLGIEVNESALEKYKEAAA